MENEASSKDHPKETPMTDTQHGDVSVRLDGHVALIEIHRPPHNYFDAKLIQDLAEAFEAMDSDLDCRALVLASEGRSFCVGGIVTPSLSRI